MRTRFSHGTIIITTTDTTTGSGAG
ncbi:Thr operon leader peptide [Sodalis praecaptivus]|uniref:Thr operon leader peptide n=1 Tax=Sodalis praecaptivus TaxID=1239307 RepID=W0I1R7_9GAMM|nr:Thr operon leader peptide [Sodalis praecaptivus]